jgi:hypothetical protein
VRRRLFKLAVALSLALCLATVGLWVRSYSRIDGFRPPFAQTLSIGSGRGQIVIEWMPPDVRLALIYHLRPYARHGFFIGIFTSEWLDRSDAAAYGYPVGTTSRWQLGLNDWFIVLLFALLPAAQWIRRRVAARRFGPGQCRRCGYDLRATPDRCPECGEDVKSGLGATV